MPNRIIKESTCTSDTIDQMTWFEECFFHRLWTACDDYGRMDARPAILKSKLFPLKERLSLKDIQNALQKMVDIGCVRLYECDSKPYLYLPSWEVHQQIRAKKSKYPAPDEACNHMISSDIKCPRNPIQSESESESKESAPARRARGKYGWVKLTDEEYQRLEKQLGADELKRCIDYIDESAQLTQNKNRWKDWFVVIQRCHRDGWGTHSTGRSAGKQPQDYQPTLERVQKNDAWLDTFLAEQEGGGQP